MSAKFGGTFIGQLYVNGRNPTQDTIIFDADTVKGRSVYKRTGPNIALYRSTTLFLQNSTQATYGSEFSDQTFDKTVNCGTANISQNGKNLTLSYSPLMYTGEPNSDSVFTFIGAKQ